MMMKLTFTLAAALYAGFVIWGRPTDGIAEAATDDRPVVNADAPEYADPVILDDDGSAPVARAATTDIVVPEASVIAASAPDPSDTYEAPVRIGQPTRISLIDSPAALPDTDATDAVAAALEASGDVSRMVVTGSRVNLRSGPSTGNEVLTSLSGGTEVEAIGDPVDGWMELRDPATGQRGFMSANFLAPA